MPGNRHTQLYCLEGSTPEDGSGASTLGKGYCCGSRGAFLYCQRQLFCFVAFRQPAGQTRKVGRFNQASLLAWMNITTWLQGRKPRESNKLFDLFLLQANPLNPSYPW